MLRALRRCGAVVIALGVLASPAMADPVGGNTLSPITLEGGGTVGGSITFDATGAISDWNIVVTSGAFGGFNFTSFTYTNQNSTANLGSSFAFGGRTLQNLDIRTPDYNANITGGRDLGLIIEAIPAVIPPQGQLLGICSDAFVCNDPLFTSIHSGEIIRNPTSSQPFGVAIRNVTAGSFTISDPPGSISLNFTLDPVLISVDGSGGGGTTVPEPGILAQLGTSAAVLFGMMVRRRKA